MWSNLLKYDKVSLALSPLTVHLCRLTFHYVEVQIFGFHSFTIVNVLRWKITKKNKNTHFLISMPEEKCLIHNQTSLDAKYELRRATTVGVHSLHQRVNQRWYNFSSDTYSLQDSEHHLSTNSIPPSVKRESVPLSHCKYTSHIRPTSENYI